MAMTPDSLNLNPFRQALDALRRALAQPKDEYLRDTVIQRFKFTYELGWKALKRYLESDEGTESVDALPRRDLFRMAAEKGLLETIRLNGLGIIVHVMKPSIPIKRQRLRKFIPLQGDLRLRRARC